MGSGGRKPRWSQRPKKRKRQSFGEFINSPKVTGWGLVVIAVGCAVGAVVSLRNAAKLEYDGVRAQATVVAIHHCYGSRGCSDNVDLTFTTREGQHIQADHVSNYSWDPEPQVGDRAEIVYDVGNPAGNVAEVNYGPNYVAPGFFAVAAVVAACLAPPTFSGRIKW